MEWSGVEWAEATGVAAGRLGEPGWMGGPAPLGSQWVGGAAGPERGTLEAWEEMMLQWELPLGAGGENWGCQAGGGRGGGTVLSGSNGAVPRRGHSGSLLVALPCVSTGPGTPKVTPPALRY